MLLKSFYRHLFANRHATKFRFFCTNSKIKELSHDYEKIAFVIGYNGHQYSGFQRNRKVRNIEEEFLLALLKSNLISQNEYSWPTHFLRMNRASRTDKGVSAVHQVITIYLPKTVDNLVEKINAELPSDIRIFGYKNVMKSFDCRKYATSRTYTYMIPTFAFCPIEELTTEQFRTTKSITDRINEVLQQYVGDHPFHNFSSGRKAEEPESRRVIMNMECSEPFIQEGLQFYTITVTGRSFIYHQIRKMIALTIAIIKGTLPEDAISIAWESSRRYIPLAPGLGLVLENIDYDVYNNSICEKDGFEPLQWDDIKEEIVKFKCDHIQPHIASTEKQERVTMKWLPELLLYSYEPIPPKTPRLRTTIGKIAFCLKSLREELENSSNLNEAIAKRSEV